MLSFALLLGVAVVGLQVLDWQGMTAQLRTADENGRTVVLISAPPEKEAKIDVRSCDALMSVAGVEASGVVIPQGRLSYNQIGTDVLTMRVSDTLIPEINRTDAVVGAALGVQRQGILTAASGEALMFFIAASQPAGVDVNSTVMRPLHTSDSVFSMCTVRLSSFAQKNLLTPTLLASLSSAGDALVSHSVSESIDPVSVYEHRATRWAPLLGGALASAIGLLLLASRGSELAAYRLSGTSALALYLIGVVEQSILAAVLWLSSALATVLLVALGVLSGQSPTAIMGWSGAAAMCWIVVYSALSWLATRRDPTVLARAR